MANGSSSLTKTKLKRTRSYAYTCIQAGRQAVSQSVNSIFQTISKNHLLNRLLDFRFDGLGFCSGEEIQQQKLHSLHHCVVWCLFWILLIFSEQINQIVKFWGRKLLEANRLRNICISPIPSTLIKIVWLKLASHKWTATL